MLRPSLVLALLRMKQSRLDSLPCSSFGVSGRQRTFHRDTGASNEDLSASRKTMPTEKAVELV